MSRKIKKTKKSKKRSSAQKHPRAKKAAPQSQSISLSLDQTYQLAVQYFQAGSLTQAEELCQQMLNVDPENFQGNHLIGIILAQQGGKNDSAVQYIRKAIQVDPSNAGLHNDLGNIFQESGRIDEAITSYNKSLSIKPDYVDAYNNLGLAFKESGNLDEAFVCFMKVLSINPDNIVVHNNLGLAYKESGNLDEAITSYRKAVSINPNYEEAHINLGLAYKESDKLDEAIASFRKAVSINPNSAKSHNNLGNLLFDIGKKDEAITCYRNALSLKPGYAEAYNNLGNVLSELNMVDAAVASFRKAISLKPDYTQALNNLGHVLRKSGKTTEALKCFQEVILHKPDRADTHNSIGVTYLESGKLDAAAAYFKKALHLKADYFVTHSNLLLVMNYSSNIFQKEIFGESLVFGRTHTAGDQCRNHSPLQSDIERSKLRIGYLSPDFRTHSVAFFFEPLLKAHNRESFEIYCYSDVRNPDNVTDRIRKETDHWITISGKNDTDIITQIKRDRIDILVDLAGHTANNRIPMFARKPAPIQVSWLGYPNTTGLEAIDYRFTDASADPVGTGDEFHSEELIRLEDGFLCYQAYEDAPGISAPPCLESETVTFGSFNNLSKVTPEVIKVWSEILLKVPNSRLLLKAKQLNDESVKKRYMKMFAEGGISPDRIELLCMTPDIVDHLATYNTVDIALDPFPYNGTTSTCEALWMGVPVVTLLGERHSGRVGASILHTFGMSDLLVADSINFYIEKAIELANDKEQLQKLRKNLRQQMKDSLLCDAASFAKKIEEAYLNMWARYTEAYVKEN